MGITEQTEHEIIIKGINLLVKPGVFNPDPANTNSTSIVLDNLPDLTGKRVFDAGTGTGVIAVYCALHGSGEIIAGDTNEKALENARENAKRNGVENIVQVVKSDLFANVTGNFDYIVGNLPISNKHWNLEISTEDLMIKFLRQAKTRVNPNGRVCFAWYENTGLPVLRDFLAKEKYNVREVVDRKPEKIWYFFEVQF